MKHSFLRNLRLCYADRRIGNSTVWSSAQVQIEDEKLGGLVGVACLDRSCLGLARRCLDLVHLPSQELTKLFSSGMNLWGLKVRNRNLPYCSDVQTNWSRPHAILWSTASRSYDNSDLFEICEFWMTGLMRSCSIFGPLPVKIAIHFDYCSKIRFHHVAID